MVESLRQWNPPHGGESFTTYPSHTSLPGVPRHPECGRIHHPTRSLTRRGGKKKRQISYEVSPEALELDQRDLKPAGWPPGADMLEEFGLPLRHIKRPDREKPAAFRRAK